MLVDFRGPPSPQLKLNGENYSVIHISELEVGKYTFKLTVTDRQGASKSATVNVDVIVGKSVHHRHTCHRLGY